jgi:hypothetical protein
VTQQFLNVTIIIPGASAAIIGIKKLQVRPRRHAEWHHAKWRLVRAPGSLSPIALWVPLHHPRPALIMNRPAGFSAIAIAARARASVQQIASVS